jgi:hypothetical protein
MQPQNWIGNDDDGSRYDSVTLARIRAEEIFGELLFYVFLRSAFGMFGPETDAKLTRAVRTGGASKRRRLNRLLRGGLGFHLAFSLEADSTRRSRTS